MWQLLIHLCRRDTLSSPVSTNGAWAAGGVHFQYGSNNLNPDIVIYGEGSRGSFNAVTAGTPCILIYTILMYSNKLTVS